MTKRLLNLYTELLETAGLYVSEDGYVNGRANRESIPIVVKGRRLVLPTQEHLENPNWEKRVVFHPLYESVGRGESDVASAYRSCLNLRLNEVFGMTMARLLELAASTAEHTALTPDQTEYLDLVQGADTKCLENLQALMDEYPGDRCMVNIFIKPSGIVNKEKYTRVGVVSFPLYEALVEAREKKSQEIKTPKKEVKIRVKDRDLFIKLFEFIIPQIAIKHAHDVGSLSKLAPTMDALMNASINVIAPLNDLIRLFDKKLVPDPKKILFPTDWTADFEDLSRIASEVREIPMMQGNEGANPRAPAKPEPVAPPQAAPAPSPYPGHPYPPQGYYPPPPPPGYPGYYPPAAPPPPPGPALTNSGKVDFNSVQRVLPHQPQFHQPQYQQQPAQRTPGWAAHQPQGQQGGPQRKMF